MSRPLVPVVDLEPWWDGRRADRTAVAAQLDAACRSTGFLQVVGHRVEPAVITAAFAAADAFFAQPDEVKAQCRPEDPAIYRGWSSRRSESFAYSTGVERPPDLVEAFVLGADDVDPGPIERPARDLFAPNVWPEHPAGFRDAVWGLYTRLRALSLVILDVAAVALDLPAGFFRERTRQGVSTMRANWYQRLAHEHELLPGQLSLGAHTDYGICTVVAADPGPGLEVVAPDGSWCGIDPAPGALVVNIGDVLAIWTDDQWHSTIHRVVPRPGVRRSFALFQDGDLDAVVEVLPAFRTAGRPSRYPTTTLGEHLLAKITSGRTATPPTAAVQTTGERLGTA